MQASLYLSTKGANKVAAAWGWLNRVYLRLTHCSGSSLACVVYLHQSHSESAVIAHCMLETACASVIAQE